MEVNLENRENQRKTKGGNREKTAHNISINFSNCGIIFITKQIERLLQYSIILTMATVIIMAGMNYLQHIIQEAHRFGSPRILIVVGKEREAIETVIQESCETAIVNKITYIFQSVQKGTGHAAMCCLPHLHMNERVLILSGDTPYIKAETMALMTRGSNGTCSAFNKIRVMTDEKKVNCGVYFTTGRILMMRLPFLSNANAESKYHLEDIVKGVDKDVDIELFESSFSNGTVGSFGPLEVPSSKESLEVKQMVKSEDNDTPF
jgi:bifunctional N-acetylglucosamine-1-phosphate-uridyltransferase/glucosamine-1-phosphate-acetyltransferase GlmU-like protein